MPFGQFVAPVVFPRAIHLRSSLLKAVAFAGVLSCLAPAAVFATPAPIMSEETDSSQSTGDSDASSGFLSGVSRSSAMLGDMGGLRPWLGRYGVSFALQETSEVLGNVSGGIHQGFDYDGLTQMVVQMDTQRAFGLYGGTFNISALQIRGRNLSADNLGTLQTSSGIEADRATRLWELWYDQKFLNEDRLDVKIGQQSLDQEFMVSQNANLFVNTMFGWPMLPSADMPGGGPAYPLSAPGVRLRGRPTDSITVMAGVFNGSPAVNNSGDSQQVNPSGTSFPLNGGALTIGEVQYAFPSLGSMVSPDDAHPLSGTYKLGVWYDTENFADQEFDSNGISLATSPTGYPMQHRGDYGIYAVADQMLWQSDEPGEAEHVLSFFTRVMGTPQADRNAVDFSMNAGFTLHEPFEHRDDDTAGIGVGYAHVSSRLAALDQDMTAAGTYTPTQTGETYVEATYQYQVFPWWIVQPDFQYIFNVGAGAVNPNTGDKIKNEAVLGVRTTISF
jgi:porin